MIAIPAADNRGPLQLSGFDRRSDVNVRNLSGSGQPQAPSTMEAMSSGCSSKSGR